MMGEKEGFGREEDVTRRQKNTVTNNFMKNRSQTN